MGASKVSPEAREQAIAALKMELLRASDEIKADTRARMIESKAYDVCQTFEEWNFYIEKHRHAIQLKIQQKHAAQQQPMGYIPPPMQQPIPQMHYQQPYQQQQVMAMMQPHPQQQQQMYPSAYPAPLPSQHQQQQQQQGWVQPLYGYQMPVSQPPQQQQQQSYWNGMPQQSHGSGWGGAPAPHPHFPPQVAMQNSYPIAPLAHNYQTVSPPAPLVAPNPQGERQPQPQSAFDDFRNLQQLARKSFLKDARDVANFMKSAAAKANVAPDQNAQVLFKAISYIELEDLAKFPGGVTPSQVAGFKQLLKVAQDIVQHVKNIDAQKRNTSTSPAAAPPAPPLTTQLKEEEEVAPVVVPIKEDPTEKLLQILKDQVFFPSAVAACLKNQLEQTKQQREEFPLPKI